jgi:hypothetical protein
MALSGGAKTLLTVASLSAGMVWYIHYSQERDKAVGGVAPPAAATRRCPRLFLPPPQRPPEPDQPRATTQAMRQGVIRDEIMYAQKMQALRAGEMPAVASGDANS